MVQAGPPTGGESRCTVIQTDRRHGPTAGQCLTVLGNFARIQRISNGQAGSGIGLISYKIMDFDRQAASKRDENERRE